MRLSAWRIAVVQAAYVVMSVVPCAAQVQRGAIHGTVRDATGAVLPGVTIQLTSALGAPWETASGPRGEFRFPDLDPGAYTLRAALDGFAPLVREAIVVGVGGHVEIRIEMVIADVAEVVNVEAATPVLDVRRQGNVTNFDQVMLNEIPTARDPWALMQHLPGVSISRPNVGGSESTNQAQFAARGDNGTNTMWNIDGVTITDMAAIGASMTFYDFNAFEEVQFTTGSLDARQQTGALGINLVTKRGTNALRASTRAYFTNADLQTENISSDLRADGLSGNRIRQLAEYGGDAGGPLWKDRLWFWAAASRNDVRQLAINGFPDDSIINTAAFRADAQMASTRLSFLYHRGEKLKDGRGAGLDRPPETTWDQSGPAGIYKAELSQIFAPALFLSAKFAYVDSSFSLTPQGGLESQAWLDFAAQVWHGSFQYFSSERTQYQWQLDGNWSRGRHEIKFGFQHRDTSSDETFGWPGDGTITWVNLEALGLPAGVGFANLTRRGATSSVTHTTSFYAGDVTSIGRWTFDLGLRFDHQRGRNTPAQVPASGLAPSILPPLTYEGGPYRTWRDLSPRLGATFRVSDRTLARASYARFASQLGSGLITFDNAAQPARIQYLFRDDNGDRLAQPSELLNPTGSVMGVNPANPAAPYSPNQVDEDLSSPATHVFIAGVERELMPNFSVGLNLGRSHLSNTIWPPFIGLTRDDFVEYRTAAIGSDSSSTPVYRLVPGVSLPPGSGRILTNRDGYHQRYWNIDLVGTKRLANRWMFRGFLTLQRQREYFDDPSRSIQDPTPRFDPAFASGFEDGGLVVNLRPEYGSEFVIQAKWIYSLAGLYELPWDLSVSGALYGRQGYPTAEAITINRPDGLGPTQVLADRDLDANRLPGLHLLDVRLQKRFALGPARATIGLDVFNALNTAVVLRQFREATSTSFRRPQELVAPRLVRLGLQLGF